MIQSKYIEGQVLCQGGVVAGISENSTANNEICTIISRRFMQTQSRRPSFFHLQRIKPTAGLGRAGLCPGSVAVLKPGQ